MRYLCSADWHVRSSIPQHRLDAYPETILYKIEFMVNTANEYDANMLVAGDLFHGTSIHPYHLNLLIQILRECDNEIFTIPGQHDQSYHREDLAHSPYRTLEEAGVIEDLHFRKTDEVDGYGWGTDLHAYNFTDKRSIVMVHHCVTPDEPPFFLEESALAAERVLDIFENYKFIICGDYHTPHKRSTDNRILINCGSIGRSNRDQLAHTPACYLIDTDNPGKVKTIKIPIASSEEIFSKAAHVMVDEDDSFSDQIKELAEIIKQSHTKIDFANMVRLISRKAKLTPRQKEIAKELLR